MPLSEHLATAAALPPGPGISPEDQARIWLESPCGLLDACHRKYGDIFTLRLGDFGTMVIVADPEGAGALFKAPQGEYECRHFNDSYRYVMGDNALFVQDGDAHRRLKRMLAPPFRGAALGAHGEVIRQAALNAARTWQDGEAVRLRPMLHEITLECLLAFVFGDREAPREEMLGWFRASVWRDMRSWKAWTRLSRLRPAICALLASELALRREGLGDRAPDLLDMLAAARDAEGAALSNEEIQDQVMMLMITAGDAVAVATAWALWRVAANPDLQDRLRAEADALGPDPDPAALAARPLLTATAQEALRLHPALPTVSGRRLTAPQHFMGWDLPAGVTLAPCEYLIHRRADLFDDPLAFRPDRFIGRSYRPGDYFPFGGGQRACVGTHLAPLTLKLILSAALSQVRLSPPDAAPGTVRFGTLLAPDQNLALTATRL
jgi:cytochrome P450